MEMGREGRKAERSRPRENPAHESEGRGMIGVKANSGKGARL